MNFREYNNIEEKMENIKTKRLNPEEKWENATLANSFIFYKVMRHHPDECKKIIEMLLDVKIEKMEVHSEETIDLDHDSKGIRLDVFVKDSKRMYDIEMQILDTKELPERSRYYSALMALDTLKPGDLYSDLRDSHVIFICMEDIFKNGLPIDTFEFVCQEDNKTKLNDRDYRHFFIAPICAKIAEKKEIKDFFEFLISNQSNSDLTSRLKTHVEDAKHNMQWRNMYMTFERMQAYAFKDGLEEGKLDAKIEAAENFLKEGDSPEKVSRCTGLPLEQVMKLAESISVNV